MNIELSKKEIHHLIYALTCAIDKETVVEKDYHKKMKAIEWYNDLRSRLNILEHYTFGVKTVDLNNAEGAKL